MEQESSCHKGSAALGTLRFVTGCALIGCVTTGAFLAWLPLPFDVRYAGMALGLVGGLIVVAVDIRRRHRLVTEQPARPGAKQDYLE